MVQFTNEDIRLKIILVSIECAYVTEESFKTLKVFDKR